MMNTPITNETCKENEIMKEILEEFKRQNAAEGIKNLEIFKILLEK